MQFAALSNNGSNAEVGLMWKNLTESERAPYKLLAEEDQLRYARVCTCVLLFATWLYRMAVLILFRCYFCNFNRSVMSKVFPKVGRAAKAKPDTTYS